MKYIGIAHKMATEWKSANSPVGYSLTLGNTSIDLNSKLNLGLVLRFTGRIFCTVCGKKTNKSFGEGMCYSCFSTSPENSPCIIRPELCEAHLGKGRDVAWEEAHHLKPHIVYLAVASAVKVGVTRDVQIPTRWIDQGASQAIKLAVTPYRQLAGAIEIALKKVFTDKTNWQQMLKNQIATDVDLLAEKNKALQFLPDDLAQYACSDNEIVAIQYPVLRFPTKIKSLSLDKVSQIEGQFNGIKGQYLLLDDEVFNMRSHSGYEIEMEWQ